MGVPRHDDDGRILCCGDGTKKHFYTCGLDCDKEPRYGGRSTSSSTSKFGNSFPAKPSFDPFGVASKADDDGENDRYKHGGSSLHFGWATQEEEDDAIFGKSPFPGGSPEKEMAYLDFRDRVHLPKFDVPPKVPFGFKKLPETMSIGHLDNRDGELYFNTKTRILTGGGAAKLVKPKPKMPVKL